MSITVKEINNRLIDFKKTKEPKVLFLGYKTYSRLLKENKFLNNLTKASNDPMTRYYNEIKIKIVTEKHYFEIE